jgi:hypothetical protein
MRLRRGVLNIANRACVLWALALGWLLPPTAAHAQLQLSWSAPEGCPDRASVLAAIDPALGSRVSVEAEVERHASGFTIRVHVQTDSGASREQFAADDCALFVRLLAVQVSLLGTERAAELTRPETARARAVANELRPAAKSSDVRWSGRALALAGTSPLAAFGVSVGAAYRSDPFELELRGGYLFPRDRSFAQQPAAGGTFQAWFAGLRGCAYSPWPAPSARLELAACAGIESGIVRGRGRGVMPAHTTDRPFVSLSAGLAVALSLGRVFAVRLEGDALFGLVRPDFFVRNLGELQRVPKVGVRGMFGIEARLP